MDLTGVSRQTVNNRIKSKKLKTKKNGRNILILLDENISNKEDIIQNSNEKDNTNSTEEKQKLESENTFLKKQIEHLRGDVDFLKNQLSTSNARIDSILADKREVNVLMGAFQKAMGFLEDKTNNKLDIQEKTHAQENIIKTDDLKRFGKKKKKSSKSKNKSKKKK